ncbi:efflux RND transporter periplasmic adaptor subunit [Azovibrio restrictus]|uniref:efflux RND transporter periplasmic adaptor subunit n=1 Tax=Azovibrio restrictus TaxID=146938 RepID=UPI0026F14285|nr:efflux RND transporter periplasmic adaptor subunit [Azovibrio restrictus]MDD3482734.1 efflux RND transporter periplasmic adaptor subunit [Azovibrio restrictus]
MPLPNFIRHHAASKRTSICLALAGIVTITATAWGLTGSGDAQANVPTAAQEVPVDVATAVSRPIIDWQSFSGRLEAVDRVEIRPQVSGILTAVHFKDGAVVRKGDPLFTIDPRPYAAEVARAQAQTAAAQARAAYTAAELARAERLLADNAIARRDFEEKQNAARDGAASLQAAQAALRVAKLNLDYTQIVAPIDGRMSRAEITVGNLVTANSGPALSTIVSSERIYAAFDVDEQTFLRYVNPARNGAETRLPVSLGLADEDDYPRNGQIHSVDNRLDTTSGTIRIRALFDNADGRLVPGLYARIRLGGGQERQALLINEKAVGTDQDKRFVLVVGADNKTEYREVHTGATQNGLVIVDRGLQTGERIVVNGLQRVRPGDAVSPTPVDMPGSAPARAAQAG